MDRVIFQNGTLVRKATVKINGEVYEVEPAEYSGTTPLSAENLNLMQEKLIKGIYPVGSIYMSTVSTNPLVLFGFGTWELWGQGRVPVGINTNDIDFNIAEKTGGEKNHTLTVEEIPRHKHGVVGNYLNTEGQLVLPKLVQGGEDWVDNLVDDHNKYTGGGQPHNNLQPYITCYMWKRVS